MDKKAVLRHALQNAVLHDGKANNKAVLGKVLSEYPDLRNNISSVQRMVDPIVGEINSLTLEEQEKKLDALGGIQVQREDRKELPELKGAALGRVVTRFAPAPTGPLNILQTLRAVMISYLYAKKYGGQFILRFEDTDPRTVEKQFYTMIRQDLKALGVEWDREFVQSDYMKLYYENAQTLIEKGKAYVCMCEGKDFQLLKQRLSDCPCRWDQVGKNLLRWKGMIDGKYREGQAVVRLITSMQDPNPAMRDPPLMRIVEASHPMQGSKYRVWPLYNFANAIMDGFCKVTHAFRGKEHEHNTEIQNKIYQLLGIKGPEVTNFGMMYLPGEKMHTRDIKQGIEEGRYTGWDDPRLPTVRTFLRRGFLGEAFREFALTCGLSKTDIKIDIGNLEAINRKLIDSKANRYMIVTEPQEIDISDILKTTGLGNFVKVKNHPDRTDTREVAVTDKLFVSGDDFDRFEERDVRLLELFNVVLRKKAALAKGQGFDMKTPKIQWVSKKNLEVNIIKGDKILKGIGEEALSKVEAGSLIQMVRLGFGRVEKSGVIMFAHK